MNRVVRLSLSLSLAILVGLAGTGNIHAAKSAAQIRADIARAQREAEQRRRQYETERRRKEQAQAREQAAARARAAISGSSVEEPKQTNTNSGSGRSSGPSKMIPSRLRYEFNRGDEFAWHVTMTTAPGDGQTRWKGDVYAVAIYSTENGPGEAMVIGRLACFTRRGDHWGRKESEDIVFSQRMRFGSYGVLDAFTAGESPGPSSRTLPLQMNTILPTAELLFPDVPVFYEPEGDESRGRQTCQITGRGVYGFKTATADVYCFQHTLNEQSSRPTIINKEAMSFESEGIGLVFTQKGTFDVAAGMPADSDLTYVEKFDGNFKITVAIRRRTGSGLKQARSAALALYPMSAWPESMKRVPLSSGQWELGFPDGATALKPGQAVAATIAIQTTNIKSARTYRGKVVRILSKEDALVRLDGSGEEREFDYRSLHLLK